MTMFNLPLLAQVRRSAKLEEIAEGFKTDQTRASDLPGYQWYIAAFGALLVALLVVIWWSQRHARREARFSPVRLFTRALRDLDLGPVDRVLLRLAARAGEFDQPVVLLFSPALLDQQFSAWAERLSPSPLRRFALRRLNGVMNKVFVEE